MSKNNVGYYQIERNIRRLASHLMITCVIIFAHMSLYVMVLKTWEKCAF